MANTELKSLATIIKQETVEDANTSQRIGTFLEKVVDYIDEVNEKKNASGSSGGSSLIISATSPTGVEGAEWLSTNTGIRYTFLNNKWVEV